MTITYSSLPGRWPSLGAQFFLEPFSSTRYRFVSSRRPTSRGDRLILPVAVRHIPAWIPWLSYKPAAQAGYHAGQDVLRYPMRFVKDSFVRLSSWEAKARLSDGLTPNRKKALPAHHWHSKICKTWRRCRLRRERTPKLC